MRLDEHLHKYLVNAVMVAENFIILKEFSPLIMNRQVIYLNIEKGRWIESNAHSHISTMELEFPEMMVDYRDSLVVKVFEMDFCHFGWKFNKEIRVKRSSNFHDVDSLEFAVKSVSPKGKCSETIFKNYIYNQDNFGVSVSESIITAITLIIITGNVEYAQAIYRNVLTYPFLPYNQSGIFPTYCRALNSLNESGYMIKMIKASDKKQEKLFDDFYHHLIQTYNSRLSDFIDNIVKYRCDGFLYND